MTKYHISPTTGRPNQCTASVRTCPVGGAGDHFNSKEEAKKAIEERAKATHETLPTLKKTPQGAPAPKGAPADERLKLFLKMTDGMSSEEVDSLISSSQELSRRWARGAKSFAHLKDVVFSSEKFTKDLRYTSGVVAESENPGCRGCEDPYDDYCRCRTYTGRIIINRKELVDGYYDDITHRRWGAPDTPEDEAAKEIITNVFRKHGLFDSESYEVQAYGGYYGEELDDITTTADVESAMDELASYKSF